MHCVRVRVGVFYRRSSPPGQSKKRDFTFLFKQLIKAKWMEKSGNRLHVEPICANFWYKAHFSSSHADSLSLTLNEWKQFRGGMSGWARRQTASLIKQRNTFYTSFSSDVASSFFSSMDRRVGDGSFWPRELGTWRKHGYGRDHVPDKCFTIWSLNLTSDQTSELLTGSIKHGKETSKLMERVSFIKIKIAGDIKIIASDKRSDAERCKPAGISQ